MSKKPSKKGDTISQLKKEDKKNTKKEEEEYSSSSEEEVENQDDIKEQTITKSDKPKNLKDLLNSMDEKNKAPKPKPKPKKEETTKTTKTKKTYDEPEKRTFFNSKGAGNANKIDNEAKKIKPTKNYTEKDSQREYNEDIAKPKFTSKKGKDENFVDLNKDEDVSNYIYLFVKKYIFLDLVIREKLSK